MENNDADNMKELLPTTNKIDPTDFDVTVSALLTGLGAEKYVDIFRRLNIGQNTLVELTDNDLIQIGVNDEEIRKKILTEIQNLPIYEEACERMATAGQDLTPMEIVEILEESSQHLYRIYLSVISNTLAVKKTKNITDCLLYRDNYASDIALVTLSEMTSILNSMDIALHTEMKSLTKDPTSRNKKVIVGSIGSVMVAALAVLFVRSLKQLKK
ncbi:uncharacterized protein LOC113237590 [Hyposmocoma kahamanoa]|uniref:uncharacterized protein LOC113237590 n=1 Tax=Hyposmocoma kahamanoa TaxID=1477025 RepID=UPI000E6D67A8|nr:uncharacterized protein LOC113237590 [Hyposmocoma kahamanoa]